MSNLIQIKRSTTAALPPALANGELAYTSAVDVLYIGSPNGSIVAIGGVRTPGILAPNQSIVTNASSYVNEVRVANLVATQLYANGSPGSDQILYANTTGGLYWGAAGGTGTVTSVASGDGLTGGPITSSGTLSVLANNGIIANSSGLFVDGANGIIISADGVNVLAGSDGGLVSNTTGVFIIPGSTLTTNSSGVHVNSTLSITSLTLSTALAGTSGGTGKTTMTSQAILVGNTTNGYNELTLGADGYVLQSNGSALIYDVLDGGTF